MVIYEPKPKRYMTMVLKENYVDENTFDKIHGEGHKYDFIFIDKHNDKWFKNFDEEI